MTQEKKPFIKVAGDIQEPLNTLTYPSAVDQMYRALGTLDDRAAVAWWVFYHDSYLDAGIDLHGFMDVFARYRMGIHENRHI